MNKIQLIGNLTREPELTETPNGVKVCKFGLAVARRFKRDEADFFNLVAWRGTAETCEKYLHKGNKVGITGTVETRTYEASDGSKRNAFDVIVEELDFLPNAETKTEEKYQQVSIEDEGGQLPF